MKINEGKVAKIHIYICDQGHYGSTTCGLCGVNIENNIEKECPNCGATLVDSSVSYDTGGSDF